MKTPSYSLSRRKILTGLGAFGLASCVPNSLRLEKSSKRPNILMISIDDLNDWIGCLNGHPNALTPNIDRLAARGTIFTNAHAQAPLCGPSRASLLTGMMPSTTGIYGHIADDDIKFASPATSNVIFLPEQLGKVQYHTMGIGKVFHIGSPQGAFEEWGGRHPGFGPRPKKRFHWNRKGTSTDWGAYPILDNEMPDFRSALWAANRLGRDYSDPFFLAVGFLRPHVPWYVPQKWFDKHPLDEIVLPPFLQDDLDDTPKLARDITDIPVMPSSKWVKDNNQWPAIVQGYLASVSFVDHCVGLVLDALDNGPNAEDTIVLLWSDHGYHLGEKGKFQKFTLWDRSTRVPLIFAGPGIKSGQERNEAVGLIDIYPTLSDLAGAALDPMLQGVSLKSALSGKKEEGNRAVLTTYGKGNHAVRTRNYRYIRYSDGSEELYDHRNDPNEWHNLASDKKYNSVVQRMQSYLPKKEAQWSEKSHIKLNPYFKERYGE